MPLRPALQRFLFIETPLSLLVTAPVILVLAALSDVAAPATPARVALAVIPLTLPFAPAMVHFADLAWWRPVVVWWVVTAVPAMALSLTLWTVSG